MIPSAHLHPLVHQVGKLGEGLVGSVRQTEVMPPISWDLKQPHPHHPEYSLGGVAFVHLLQFISLRSVLVCECSCVYVCGGLVRVRERFCVSACVYVWRASACVHLPYVSERFNDEYQSIIEKACDSLGA